MASHRKIVTKGSMQDLLEDAKKFSKVAVVYFYENSNDVIRKELNEITRQNAGLCYLAEICTKPDPKTQPELCKSVERLKEWLGQAWPGQGNTQLAFYVGKIGEDINPVNFQII